MMGRKFSLLFLITFLFTALPATAQAPETLTSPSQIENAETLVGGVPATADYPDLASQGAVLVFLALLPFLIMLLTSFMKMVITLALLRSALGVQQTPPNQVINGIALILTVYVMFPTGMQMYENIKPIISGEDPPPLFSASSAGLAISAIDVSKEPLREFLIRNSSSQHINGFFKLAKKSFPPDVSAQMTQKDLIIVIPAFITSQIKAAFQIGVLIYLPFFVIDLVTSNILLAMQMMMLSPLSISLPLKLLLVVMIDGWTILVQGLVLSFK